MHTPLDLHVDRDAEAAREAVSQKLRELPGTLAPPFGWSELQRRSRRRATDASLGAAGERRGGVGYRAIALAACVALLAVGAAVVRRIDRSALELGRAPARAERAQLARSAARADVAQLVRLPAGTDAGQLAHSTAHADAPLLMRPGPHAVAAQGAEALLARADAAERWLASEPDDGPIVRVSTHLAVAHLEDRIASMDDLLNLERVQHARASRLRALQLQRAQLVDSLAQVRYAEILADEAP